MKNYIQSGDVITVPAPAAVATGGLVMIGELFGFAQTDAAQSEEVAIAARGVFDAVVENGAAISTGDAVYTADGETLTADADDGGDPANANMKVGVAVADAFVEDGAAYVKIKIG